MSKFLKIFSLVFVKQIFFFLLFCLAVYINSDFSMFLPLSSLLIYLILYFIYFKKIYIKLKLTNIKFSLFYFVSWLLSGILIFSLIFYCNWFWTLLPKAPGWFSGLEYILVPIFLALYLVVWSIINLGLFIYNKLKK